MVRREPRREASLHFGEALVELLEIDRAADLKFRLDGVVFEIGREKSHGGGDTGVGGRDHLGNAEDDGDLGALQWARAPEGHKREAARVDPLLNCAGADRVRHIGVDDG